MSTAAITDPAEDVRHLALSILARDLKAELDPKRIVGEIDRIYRLAIDRSSKKRRQK